jgi:hypothetical protein
VSESNDEVKKLLQELIESTNRTLDSHKRGLAEHQDSVNRHERDIMVLMKLYQIQQGILALVCGKVGIPIGDENPPEQPPSGPVN